MRANVAVGPDSCSGKNNRKLPDSRAIANGIGSNIREFVNH
jgi:hypothetical protein